MIYQGTKENIVAIFTEAGRSLDAETKADLVEVETELRDNELSLDFIIMLGKCRICNHECTIITPAIVDLDNLECGNCEHMTMQEKEEPEWLSSK